MNEQLIYEVIDVQKILGLGRTKTYEFIQEVYKNKTPFKVVKIGRIYKISKKSFDNWLNGEFLFENIG